jgi:hypothetical protein
MERDEPTVCVDGNGFERVAFHKQFDDKGLAFSRRMSGSGGVVI